MNEKLDVSKQGGLISIDQTLVARIEKRKSEGEYGGILASMPEFRDKLVDAGFSEDELQQVPAWHAMIGSGIPSQNRTIKIERTISDIRQEEIEAKIRDYMEPFLEPIEDEGGPSLKAA